MNNVARVRKMVIPTTSWKAVSKGPAVMAGSNPRRFETIGVEVPTSADMLTEKNIETPTKMPKIAFPYQKAEIIPITIPVASPIIRLV